MKLCDGNHLKRTSLIQFAPRASLSRAPSLPRRCSRPHDRATSVPDPGGHGLVDKELLGGRKGGVHRGGGMDAGEASRVGDATR